MTDKPICVSPNPPLKESHLLLSGVDPGGLGKQDDKIYTKILFINCPFFGIFKT